MRGEAQYKPGSRWQSRAGTGEFVVIHPPSGAGELTCGGALLVVHGGPGANAVEAPPGSEGTAAGKRYTDTQSGIELICTKAGAGDLAFAGRPLSRKDAKALPASD
jgi:hypothetical protein